MKRLTTLATTVVVLMAASLMALSGAALAQTRGGGDVCLSQGGQTIYDNGPSFCDSDHTSQVVAANQSDAFAFRGSEAVAVNHSFAFASPSCSATALNGEQEFCGTGLVPVD